MRSISLINTQTQLFNCIDCIKQFGYIDNTLIVVNTTSAVHDRIMSVLDDETRKYFTTIKLFLYNPSNKWESVWNRFRIALYIRRIIKREIFDVGITSLYIHSFQRMLFYELEKRVRNIKLILVDDGIATIEYNRVRKKEIEEHSSFIKGVKGVDSIICGGVKFRNYYPQSILFFSLYKINTSPNDFLEENKRSFSQQYILDRLPQYNIQDNSIVLVGQPLARDIFSQEDYEYYLRKIYNYFMKDKTNYYYFLHPAESDESVDFIKSDNFVVLRNTLPFEYIALSFPPNVKLVSFTSSVLPNLVLMGKKLNYYSIYLKECESIDSQLSKEFLLDYEYFSSIGINVLKL